MIRPIRFYGMTGFEKDDTCETRVIRFRPDQAMRCRRRRLLELVEEAHKDVVGYGYKTAR